MAFTKATKSQARLRMALVGPSGSGKTFTALTLARHLTDGTVALIDTEHGSASKYADKFAFDVMELTSFHPDKYVQAIREAEQAGYAVLIIDSLSHAWSGKDGALEQVDHAVARSRSSNSFAAWREVTPLHTKLIDTILGSRCHIIATMRSKTEWVLEKNEKGATVPRKIGLAPVQRDGMEYEFDVVADMDGDNKMLVSKTRCPALQARVFCKPGEEVATMLRDWLSDGVPVATPTPLPPPEMTGQKAFDTAIAEYPDCHFPSDLASCNAMVKRHKELMTQEQLATLMTLALAARDRINAKGGA